MPWKPLISSLSARLSQSGRHSVLLIEPGGKTDTFKHRLPLNVAKLVFDPKYAWLLESGPETALQGQGLFAARPLGLGGSSAINGTIWAIGARTGWDAWRDLGCTGWGWDDVQPYFHRTEKFVGDKTGGRGHDGPISIEWQRPEALGKAFLDAGREAGFPAARDDNSGTLEGYTPLQTNTRNGWRCSTWDAYLKPAAGRASLDIRTGLYADRLIIDGNRVTGVRCVRRDGDRPVAATEFYAGREVILAAGAYHTPLLLEGSGIGDPEVLAARGIAVAQANRHVGAHLLDHMRACIGFRVKGALTVNQIAGTFSGKLRAAADFFLRRQSWLRTATMNAQLATRSGVDGDRVDLKLQLNGIGNDFSRRAQLNYPFETEPGLSLLAIPIYPRARGHIHLTGPTPWDHPGIFTSFMGDPHDRQVTSAGLRLARKIAAQPAFQPYLVQETWPGDGIRSDDELLDYARGTGLTVYHPVGTCRMAAPGQGVVDHRLKMQDFDGLRLADASVMPVLTASNTNAPAIVIGERAATWALEDAAI